MVSDIVLVVNVTGASHTHEEACALEVPVQGPDLVMFPTQQPPQQKETTDLGFWGQAQWLLASIDFGVAYLR